MNSIVFLFISACVSVSQRGFKRHVSKTLRVLKERQEEYFENMDPKEKLELERRSKFTDWNYSSEIYAFGKRLQEDFLPELLVQAFTHRCCFALFCTKILIET